MADRLLERRGDDEHGGRRALSLVGNVADVDRPLQHDASSRQRTHRRGRGPGEE